MGWPHKVINCTQSARILYGWPRKPLYMNIKGHSLSFKYPLVKILIVVISYHSDVPKCNKKKSVFIHWGKAPPCIITQKFTYIYNIHSVIYKLAHLATSSKKLSRRLDTKWTYLQPYLKIKFCFWHCKGRFDHFLKIFKSWYATFYHESIILIYN